MPKSVRSLDSISLSSSEASYDSDEEDRLAEQEWRESLDQLQQLFSIVLLPYLGKWLGRRWSYWGASLVLPPFDPGAHVTVSLAYARYIRLGLGKPFFLGEKRF